MAVNHNKGSSLAAGQTLVVGDFLISANGLFVGVLEPNGSFAVYWNQLDQVGSSQASFAGQLATQIWRAPGDNPGPHFMIMQTDGNLVVYQGSSFQDGGSAIWASDSNRSGGGTYVAVLENTGRLRVKRDGVTTWQSDGWAVEVGARTCVSGVNYNTSDPTQYALSSKPPSGTGAPTQGRASVTVLGATPTDDQVWRRFDWVYRDVDTIGHPEKSYGTVLINKQTGLALGSDGAGKTVMTPFVDDNAAWAQGSAEYGTPDKDLQRMAALRLFRDERLNLNVKGDAPYSSGAEVLLWNWNGVQENLVWRFGEAPAPALVPA